MASYYPEGECYFVRNSLRYSRHWNAENRTHFYSHVLVEYYWNGWTAIGNNTRSHQRSQWRSGTPSGINNTRFGDWDRFWVGESRNRNPATMTAIHSHPNSLNWNECRDLNGGGPRKYILRPIQIHDRDAEWLWIDATIPIRAVYFPVAHETDQAFPNLCTYVVIDFRHRTEVVISDIYGFSSTVIRVTPHSGLGRQDHTTWGFHIPDIIAYLTIPHKLRNPDHRLFSSKNRSEDLVVSASSSIVWRTTSTVIHHPDFFREMDVAQILSATFGVEVGWRPYEPSNFLRNLLISLIDLGLGFIPGVGPLLSVAFGIAVQLLEDPESFAIDNILDLNQAILENLTRSSNRHNKYLAPGFKGKARGGSKALVSLSDDERARRQQHGEELNEKLTKELAPNVVIRSLFEQELLIHGNATHDGPLDEGEETVVETVSIGEGGVKEETEEDDNKEVEQDENKKEE